MGDEKCNVLQYTGTNGQDEKQFKRSFEVMIKTRAKNEVRTASSIRVMNHRPDDGGITFLRNVGPFQRDYTSYSPP
jgi:hypothetical protein